MRKGHLLLGRALVAKGDYDKAIESLNEAIARTPDDPNIVAALGEAYEKKGAPIEALKRYSDAVQLNPNDAHLQLQLARLADQLGASDRAAEAYRAAMAKGGGDVVSVVELAQLYKRKGELEQAAGILNDGLCSIRARPSCMSTSQKFYTNRANPIARAPRSKPRSKLATCQRPTTCSHSCCIDRANAILRPKSSKRQSVSSPTGRRRTITQAKFTRSGRNWREPKRPTNEPSRSSSLLRRYFSAQENGEIMGQLLEILNAGGIFMYGILVTSVVSLAVIVQRFYTLWIKRYCTECRICAGASDAYAIGQRG